MLQTSVRFTDEIRAQTQQTILKTLEAVHTRSVHKDSALLAPGENLAPGTFELRPEFSGFVNKSDSFIGASSQSVRVLGNVSSQYITNVLCSGNELHQRAEAPCCRSSDNV